MSTRWRFLQIVPCITIVFAALWAYGGNYGFSLFDFSHDYSNKNERQSDLWTLEAVVKRAIESGLDTREQLLNYYVAHQSIIACALHLLPEINLLAVVGAGMGKSPSLDAIVPLVGFLLPSRWFELRASRHIKKAEKESLITVFANSAQEAQLIYLDIQRQIWSIRVLEFYHREIDAVIRFFQQEKATGLKRLNDDDIAVLENIKGKIAYERAFVDSLSASFPLLATALGLDPQYDWSSLPIQTMPMRFLKLKKRHYGEFSERAFARSSELKAARQLIEATREENKGIYFDFIDPDSGNNLGFIIGPRVKIASASVAILQNRFMQTKMQISNAIQGELNNYNDVVESLPALNISLTGLVKMKEGIDSQINNKLSPIDLNEIIRLIKYAKGAAIRYVNAYFIFKSAEAGLHRLTWTGEIFEIVNDYRFYELPKFFHKIRKELSFRQAVKRKFKKRSPRSASDTNISPSNIRQLPDMKNTRSIHPF